MENQIQHIQHRGRVAVILIMAILLVFAASGCRTLTKIGVETMLESEGKDSTTTEESTAKYDESHGAGVSYLPEEMLLSIAYIYGFDITWFVEPGEVYEVGTGTVWRMIVIENGEKTVVESERALLDRQSDEPSLWYIRVDISGEGAEKDLELEYEAWVNEDNEVIEYAYRDPETDEVVYKELPEGKKLDNIESPTGRDEELDSWKEEWEEWRQEVNVSSESVTVGAGTFETDRMSHEERDEETGDRQRRVIWRTKEVPDHTVKFLYENLDEEVRLEGELLSVKHDYRMKFYVTAP